MRTEVLSNAVILVAFMVRSPQRAGSSRIAWKVRTWSDRLLLRHSAILQALCQLSSELPTLPATDGCDATHLRYPPHNVETMAIILAGTSFSHYLGSSRYKQSAASHLVTEKQRLPDELQILRQT